MKYYIQRELNEYGPYTLADLQRYVAQGSILPTDLTRSEGMTEWTPVSQVIGNIPIPAASRAAGAYAGGAVYGGSGTVYDGSTTGLWSPGCTNAGNPTRSSRFPLGLVLLIGIFTCGLFFSAWMIVEAVFVRKIKPESKGLMFVIISIALSYLWRVRQWLHSAMNHANPQPVSGLITLISVAILLVGAFQMRRDMKEYYNRVEPISLRLSGVMTFFFAIFYFQHHFSRIAQWKKTGILAPQGS